MSVYYSKLVSRVFETWRERFERAQEITLFQELVVERGQVAVKRRAFQHWKLCILWSSRCKLMSEHNSYNL